MQLNIFLYDIDFVDVEVIGELCRRSTQKFEKSVKRLLLQQSHLLRQQHQRIVQSLPVH